MAPSGSGFVARLSYVAVTRMRSPRLTRHPPRLKKPTTHIETMRPSGSSFGKPRDPIFLDPASKLARQ